MKRCIIVGAGDYSATKWIRDSEDYVIAADGGYEALKQIGQLPDVLIGDMDSLSNRKMLQQARNQGVELIELPPEKDDTDMLAAIKHGLEKGCKRFDIYGGLGKRLDHTIANIQCLLFLKKHKAEGILYGKNSRTLLLCDEKMFFPANMKGTFSAFAFGGDAKGVTERGLKYALEDALVRQEFPIGVSNEFIGQESMIEVTEGMLLIHIIEEQ